VGVGPLLAKGGSRRRLDPRPVATGRGPVHEHGGHGGDPSVTAFGEDRVEARPRSAQLTRFGPATYTDPISEGEDGMGLPPIYDPEAVAPMWQELAAVGVEPLTTPEQVDQALEDESGSTLVIVNSVCGCAAGQARPGAMLALQHSVIPDRSVTVFAGVDRDAVNRAREYMASYPPSSPSMALFRNGHLRFMLQRADLQQMDEEQVSTALRKAFDEHCSRSGPSIEPEKFKQIRPHRGCGSQIPLAGV
jgi:putative YphP/YqiW family bacilliredoxin